MGFTYEYTYQGREYIIRTTYLLSACATHSACYQTLYIWVFLLHAAGRITLSRSKHICDQVNARS